MRLGLLINVYLSLGLAQDTCTTTLIQQENDINRIRNCQRFKGHLVIDASVNPISVTLPQLQEIDGSLLIAGAQVTALVAPQLTRIVNDFVISSVNDLQIVQVPLLKQAHSFLLDNVTATVAIIFDAGFRVDIFTMINTKIPSIQGLLIENAIQPILIKNNTRLKTLELTQLKGVNGDLYFENNPSLESAKFPSLVRIGRNLVFKGNTQLTELVLSNLETIGKQINIESHSLTEVDLGKYRLSSGSKFFAPVECDHFRDLYKEAFNYDACQKEVAAYDQAHTTTEKSSDSLPLKSLFGQNYELFFSIFALALLLGNVL